MSQAAVRAARWLTLGALCLAYAMLAHHTNTDGKNTTLGMGLAIAPIACLLLSVAWHAPRRRVWLGLLGAAGLFGGLNWAAWSPYYAWFYWAEHAGTQVFLCYFFGRTLLPKREPLCTMFARLVHGQLDPPVRRYTRYVTMAWTAFFGMMAATSTLLFLGAPLAVWSAFANFFTAPLIVAMFVVEYAVRRACHPHMEHAHILDAVKLFWNSGTASSNAKV